MQPVAEFLLKNWFELVCIGAALFAPQPHKVIRKVRDARAAARKLAAGQDPNSTVK